MPAVRASKISAMIRALPFRDKRGSVAIMTALCLLGIVGMVGAAVDYSRLVTTRTALQAFADQALVAAASSARSAGSEEDLQTAADKYMNANWGGTKRGGTATIVVTKEPNNELSGTAKTTLQMTFMKVLGFNAVDVISKASLVYGQNSAEVALVLDTTGSMSGQPLSDLQAASKALLDTVYAAPGADEKVKVAVVPFGQYVNVGMQNRNKPWMSVPANSTQTSNVCAWNSPIISQKNCKTKTGIWYNDGVPTSYEYQECDNVYGAPVQTCGPQTTTVTWNGCAGSRNYPLNIQAAVSSGQPVPGVMNVWCGSEVLRLTTSRPQIDDSIASLTATGETFIQSGLIWGWRTLSPDAPYSDATSPTDPKAARKVLVLMTDGANTRSPNYPDHEGFDPTLADKLMGETCTAIKAQKINIFTVAFNVTDANAKKRLSDCATSSSQFFDAPTAASLKTAFSTIGQSLSALYLKK
jgi:Flp pilus assembly protein TadG